jgi:ABC-type uncharacterized transport system permease subunit
MTPFKYSILAVLVGSLVGILCGLLHIGIIGTLIIGLVVMIALYVICHEEEDQSNDSHE